ncbi:MAG: family 43 glycosylhydrolase [Kiritimatiellia bacterium]
MKIKTLLPVCLMGLLSPALMAQEEVAAIRVEGRHFVDSEGKCVRLIGPMHSMCPFFSGGRWGDGQDDAAIARCLDYTRKICHGIADRSQGSYLNMIRLTDDAYWSHDDNLRKAAGEKTRPYVACDWARYHRYVEKVLVPAAEIAVSEGLYVIIRPSYNTEGDTVVGDGYNRHLVREWEVISANPRLKALSGKVLFELENEPVNVETRDGHRTPDQPAVTDYMQPMVDAIRKNGWNGIILVPGFGYQSHFRGFLSNPIRDPQKNYGFAVHVYPGWYAQNDQTADPERFLAHFLHQVPVALDYPCVVTEVDWSPEKPGAGKKNEFGEYVPANWGSWGTGSTSQWGNAYLSLLERLGNISTLTGGIDLYFDIGAYLKTGQLHVGYEGNPECCAKAFWDLGAKWAKEKKVAPVERDANMPKLLSGEEVVLKDVAALTQHLFRLSVDGWELHQPLAQGNSHDFRYGPAMPVARNSIYAALFRAERLQVDGKTYYRLRNYDNHGVLRHGNLDWGNGDALCVTPDDTRYICGVVRENWNYAYGQDRPKDGLWEIAPVDGGFTFRNAANGKYLGTHTNCVATEPVVWTCTTRMVRDAHVKAPVPFTLDVRNPVIYADVPDVGLCADSNYVYMVSTTMHLVPGAPIMRSKDMQHWELITHLYETFDGGPAYSLQDPEKRVGYAAGQWATSFKHHNGRYYCYFIANGVGGFLCTADKAEGPWTMKRAAFMHDADLLFDDDGAAYLLHGDGWISKLNADLTDRAPGWQDHRILARDAEESGLLEGTRAFKRGKYYYALMISGYIPNHPRRQVCCRSTSLANTNWEKKVVLETEFDDHAGVGQGDIIQAPDGRWYALIFQDRGGVGRTPCLLQVTWEDDWPIIGGRVGEVPNNPAKPYADLRGLIASDDFSGTTLDRRWEFNHNPDPSAYSLAARPGWLRLKTVGTTDTLFMARNTLTQRMPGPECEAVMRLDVSGMADGDVAGLAALQSESAVVKVVREGAAFHVKMTREIPHFHHAESKFFARAEVNVFSSAELTNRVVWLKVHGNFRTNEDWTSVAWSVDGRNWNWAKERVRMYFDTGRFFMGAKFAVFNYATKATGGFVDVDKVLITVQEHESHAAFFRTFRLTTAQRKEVDNFSSPILDAAWYELGSPSPEWWAQSAFRGRSCLCLPARPVSLCEDGNPSLLLRHLPEGAVSASVTLAFRTHSREDFAGLVVRDEKGGGYGIGRSATDAGEPCVRLVRFASSGATTLVERRVEEAGAIRLFASVDAAGGLQFAYALRGDARVKLGKALKRGTVSSVGLYSTSNALR